MFSPTSLRVRLLGLVLLAVLPAFVLIVYSAEEQRRLAIADAQAEAVRVARIGSDSQREVIDDGHDLLTVLAHLREVLDADSTACNGLFATLLGHFPRYTTIAAAFPTGEVFCSGMPVPGPITVAEREYFRRALETREFTVGEYTRGRISGRQSLTLAQAALDPSGRVRAVVIAGLSLDWLSRLAASSRLPPGFTITLVDHAGTILARAPDSEIWTGKSLAKTPVGRAMLGRTGEGATDIAGEDGIRRLYTFVPLRGGGALHDAYVSVGTPTTVVFAGVNRLLARNLIGLGVVALLAFGAAWIAGDRLILRHVRALVGATTRLRTGDLRARSGLPHRGGELGELAQAFDDMAAALEQRASERKRAEQSQWLEFAVTRIAAESSSLGDAIPRFLEAICKGADWDLAELWSVDTDTGVLRWEAAAPAPALEAGEFVRASRDASFPPDVGLPGRAWASARPLWSDDILTDPQFTRAPAAVALGLRTALAVPVLGTTALGVIVCFSRTIRTRDDQLLEVMDNVSRRIGHFIERRRAEEALQQSEEHVRQLQRLEAVGRLAGGVAHDFNNLITVIMGRSELMLEHPRVDAQLRRNIELIQKTAERAALLTRQLLAFSRKQVLEPRVLDLNAVMSNTAAMLKRMIGEDIDLVFRPGAELGRVKADPAQLEQVIVNLVVNARDAMPEGGQLSLETANVDLDGRYARQHMDVQSGSYVMLAVTDTGVGMDAETQARIFEPFFTTKAPGKGTGLGLATVYGIVKQSGGYIWVYSEPGRGTTFKLYLPRVREADAAAERVAPAPGRGTETILVVEDEAEVRALAHDILAQYGYTVLPARDPAEAVRIVEGHLGVIHLMVTDVIMPQMSGRRLADRVVSLRPGLKVLYMSGYTNDAIAHHGILDPDTLFIQKPFTPAALAWKVREALNPLT